MTTNAIDRLVARPTAAPTSVGQATVVEQSRAVAEVQASVVVARQFPRSVPGAVASMRESCAMPALAERAFFRFPRGGQQVSGESIHLARELARCWGNIQHGVSELRRDDDKGESEMQAWAWDLETNARSSTTFIVPHVRDTRQGTTRLTDARDVYENNANMGARRLREVIFSVLPPWFVEDAKERCTETLKHGGGKPLANRIADAIDGFGRFGIIVERIEQRLGVKAEKWTDHDVAQLGVIYRSIQNGEATVEQEFPQERVTAADLAQPVADLQKRAQAARQAPATPANGIPASTAPEPETPSVTSSEIQDPQADSLIDEPEGWR